MIPPLTSDSTAQKRLRELKSKISSQSKKNFVLERDVRYLDSRIALLIANVRQRIPMGSLHGADRFNHPFEQRMALDEQEDVREHLEEVAEASGQYLDDRKQQVSILILLSDCHRVRLTHSMLQLYSNLCFLLQSEPRHVASLCRLVSLSEIDTLLQTVMFTLYGNQYESREEHLLLTMFQVSTFEPSLFENAAPT